MNAESLKIEDMAKKLEADETGINSMEITPFSLTNIPHKSNLNLIEISPNSVQQKSSQKFLLDNTNLKKITNTARKQTTWKYGKISKLHLKVKYLLEMVKNQSKRIITSLDN